MKYCKKCKVSVPSCRARCPLCQGILSGPDAEELSAQELAAEGEVFPYIPTVYRQYNLFFRTMIFVSLVIAVSAFVLNFLFFDDNWWSLFVIAGVAAVWITVAMAIRKRSTFCKRILYQVVTLSVLLVLFDLFTGWYRWSVNFIIPGLCIFALISVAIIALVMHRRIENYIIYLFVTGLFGIFPLLFLVTGWATITWPSVVSIALSILSCSGLFLFEGNASWAELKKRLHM